MKINYKCYYLREILLNKIVREIGIIQLYLIFFFCSAICIVLMLNYFLLSMNNDYHFYQKYIKILNHHDD